MRKFEADATANYANPENREDGADAILLDIYHVSKYSGVSEGITAGISPTEARDLAAKLNREADAFDAREKARQEANKPKLPTEPGIYISNSYSKYEDTDPSSFALFILDSDTETWSVKNTGTDPSYSRKEAREYAQQMVDAWGPLKRLVVED